MADDDGRPWPSLMAAWQIDDSYGAATETLTLNARADAPVAVGPEEVVVRVRASSVNPIDALMAGESGGSGGPCPRSSATVVVGKKTGNNANAVVSRAMGPDPAERVNFTRL